MRLLNISLLLIAVLSFFASSGQKAITYVNSRGDTHLSGAFTAEDLENTLFQNWYQENYQDFELTTKSKWSKSLKSTEVEIYMGTWCGDSKKWVPRFVRLWDELGLDREQLKFIGLHSGNEMYKQGPNGEEKGKMVHRVPTFIFKQEGQEYARIVESPINDLETDVAQIALGYPSEPKYRAAKYMMNLLSKTSEEDLEENFKTYLNTAYRLTSKSRELNTLGYVYLRSGRIDEALTVFKYNTYFFKYDPDVYDSYAEALDLAGLKEEALTYYEKVLELDAENENAKEKISILSAGD